VTAAASAALGTTPQPALSLEDAPAAAATARLLLLLLVVPVVQFAQLSVNDEPHDLVGALQDAVHTQVTQVALKGVVLQHTAAVHRQQQQAAAAAANSSSNSSSSLCLSLTSGKTGSQALWSLQILH